LLLTRFWQGDKKSPAWHALFAMLFGAASATVAVGIQAVTAVLWPYAAAGPRALVVALVLKGALPVTVSLAPAALWLRSRDGSRGIAAVALASSAAAGYELSQTLALGPSWQLSSFVIAVFFKVPFLACAVAIAVALAENGRRRGLSLARAAATGWLAAVVGVGAVAFLRGLGGRAATWALLASLLVAPLAHNLLSNTAAPTEFTPDLRPTRRSALRGWAQGVTAMYLGLFALATLSLPYSVLPWPGLSWGGLVVYPATFWSLIALMNVPACWRPDWWRRRPV